MTPGAANDTCEHHMLYMHIEERLQSCLYQTNGSFVAWVVLWCRGIKHATKPPFAC
jgi:hypothetical protein